MEPSAKLWPEHLSNIFFFFTLRPKILHERRPHVTFPPFSESTSRICRMPSQSVLLSVTWNTISLSFRHVSYRKKPDWNQVPPSCVNVRQVIEPLKPLPIHVRELKTEVLPRDVVKSRTVKNGPSASHLDCRCRVRYTSTGIPCWGRCPHRRGAGWPHTPATSGCRGGRC